MSWFAPLLTNWRFLTQAISVSLALTIVSMAIGAGVGLCAGLLRTYGGRLADVIVGFYVDTMRAVPVLVILVWMFFAFPIAFGVSVKPFTAAAVGLGLHIAAYLAEAIRAGLLSVRPGQTRAALALGMTGLQAIRVVVLPQALIRMLPAIGSLTTVTIKDTAIAAVIAVPELMRQSQIVAGQTYRPFELYTFAMAVYFLLCFPIARWVDHSFGRLAHKGAS
jgi:polar amino acid transport system permease protein